MTTVVNVGATTYTTDAFPASGSIPAAQVVRDLRRAAAALEPRDYPFLSSVGYGPPVSQEKHEWARRAWTPLESTVATQQNAGAGVTTLVVAAGHGKYFMRYHVLKLEAEIEWVTSVSTDTATVVRGQAGTTAAQHNVGVRVMIIGTAMPQLLDYALSPFSWGDQYFNYPQRFSGAVKGDRRYYATENYEIESGEHDKRVADELATQKLTLELALFYGLRQQGDPTNAAERPSLMGGLNQFIGGTGGGVRKTISGDLNIFHMEEALIDADIAIGSNAPRQILMNPKTKQIINRLLMPLRGNVGMDVTSAKLVWNSVTFETGDYSFMVSRNVPLGEIWLLNIRDAKVLPYRTLGWHERVLPNAGEAMWTGVGGDFTFEHNAPKAITVIDGWNQLLTAYPGM